MGWVERNLFCSKPFHYQGVLQMSLGTARDPAQPQLLWALSGVMSKNVYFIRDPGQPQLLWAPRARACPPSHAKKLLPTPDLNFRSPFVPIVPCLVTHDEQSFSVTTSWVCHKEWGDGWVSVKTINMKHRELIFPMSHNVWNHHLLVHLVKLTMYSSTLVLTERWPRKRHLLLK